MPSQRHPLRRIATIGVGTSLVIGALPTVRLITSAPAAGWITGIAGALSCLAIVAFAESEVTPLDSPRDYDGTPLIRPLSDGDPFKSG